MYNLITESCFQNCITAHSQWGLSESERKCTHLCIAKIINVRNRIMLKWMDVGPLVEKKLMIGVSMGNVELPETFL